jgi:hypothetical protein
VGFRRAFQAIWAGVSVGKRMRAASGEQGTEVQRPATEESQGWANSAGQRGCRTYLAYTRQPRPAQGLPGDHTLSKGPRLQQGRSTRANGMRCQRTGVCGRNRATGTLDLGRKRTFPTSTELDPERLVHEFGQIKNALFLRLSARKGAK